MTGTPQPGRPETVTSADGTVIAYEETGDGPPVILIGGAFNDRSSVSGLAAVLAPELTAIAYDRRGRGDSTDNSEYSVQREIEDITALIDRVGAPVALFGHSSGAVLALEAAQRGLPIHRVAVYEPPYIVDDSRPRPGADLVDRIQALLKEDRRGDAVELFLTEAVDVPGPVLAGMQAGEVWGWLTNVAHTLPYDVIICGPGNAFPADHLATITTKTLTIGGSQSPPWLTGGARAVAELIPGARYFELEGHDHTVLQQPAALRPVLLEFLT